MPKIKANGVNLHFITVGMGPDVVMLHGFLGNLAVWHLYMAASANGFADGGISIHQVLGVRATSDGESGMPATRSGWT